MGTGCKAIYGDFSSICLNFLSKKYWMNKLGGLNSFLCIYIIMPVLGIVTGNKFSGLLKIPCRHTYVCMSAYHHFQEGTHRTDPLCVIPGTKS